MAIIAQISYDWVFQSGMAASVITTVVLFLRYITRREEEACRERKYYLDLIGNHMKENTEVLTRLAEEIRSFGKGKG